MFSRTRAFDRTAILEAAGRARASGRLRKAIASYLKVLEVDPEDHNVHAKVAPLLAETRQPEKSWESFKAAADGYMKKGFHDKAVGIYSLASRCMPGNLEAWETLVRVQMDRNLKADAVRTVLSGYRNFTSRGSRGKGISLLRKGWGIAPWHPEVTRELARLHAKTGEKKEALRLLDGLAERSRGSELRRIRWLTLLISPGPGTMWRWFGAALFRG